MNMRKLVYILTFLIANIGFSQVYEAGLTYNLGSVVGERNDAFPITTSNKNWGVVIKKNMNPRISYRLAVNLMESYNTQLAELSGGIDFNFTKYNLIRTGKIKKSTGYLIFEAATIFYNTRGKTKFSAALPIGIGYKQALTKRIVFSLEAKARVSFSDVLDNIKTNKSTLDAYYYIGTSIYYTFGWPRGSKNQIRF
ncbi:hypothetical protein SAMN05444281_0636 [Wenyingzhuangia marina]|uniref:DUF6089 domain-containing protein n=2 Tax=Wenyingzhuangia marina TaxID=1195760 RepID=A0A1M5T0S9_9FLAO|nr:hypothetical protein GCM10011397_04930 [Wenyingzhuangia marina]SHH44391.1 hypothetical protein SAMN05444281_0636 [Wenyingzhuangia marina]